MNGVNYLKSTGITRKIDELGRIVIPKEIRKNLSIREGESLEIIASDENIILKKHSQIAKYNEISNKICRIFSEVYDIDIIITDREKVIAASENVDVLEKRISDTLKNYIDTRTIIIEKEMTIKLDIYQDKGIYTIYPIIDESDSIGLIILKLKGSCDSEKLCKMVVMLIIE